MAKWRRRWQRWRRSPAAEPLAQDEDRFALLPAPVYLRGFLYEYARLVGIDARDWLELARPEIEEIEAVVQGEHRAAALPQRERADVAL